MSCVAAPPVVPLRRRILAPALVGVGALGAVLIAQAVFDPFRQDIPLCAVYHLTGLYCPGCGMTRAVHALLDGDVALAVRNNLLLVLLLPAAVLVWGRWLLRSARPEDPRWKAWVPGRRTVIAAAILTGLFTVARNLPWFSFLAPTSLIGA